MINYIVKGGVKYCTLGFAQEQENSLNEMVGAE